MRWNGPIVPDRYRPGENADRIYVADWNSNKLLVVDMKGAVVDEWGADGAAGEWRVLMQATDVAWPTTAL
ncbi:MAG: hypothetical protein R2848_07485 [Thermomicrobiales bacterium]